MFAVFFKELVKRSLALYWFGIYNLFVCFSLLAFWGFDGHTFFQIIQPIKNYLSMAMASWTLGWMMYYLHPKSLRKLYTWIIILCVFIYNGTILLQSLRGVSYYHYKNFLPFESMLFYSMLICLTLFVLTLIMVTVHFFVQKKIASHQHFTWGIRLGLLFFIMASLIEGVIIYRMSPVIGGQENSGSNLFIMNWSRTYGDLRVSKFFSFTALAIIPMVSHFFLKTKMQVLLFSLFYLIIVITFLILAILKVPFI